MTRTIKVSTITEEIIEAPRAVGAVGFQYSSKSSTGDGSQRAKPRNYQGGPLLNICMEFASVRELDLATAAITALFSGEAS